MLRGLSRHRLCLRSCCSGVAAAAAGRDAHGRVLTFARSAIRSHAGGCLEVRAMAASQEAEAIEGLQMEVYSPSPGSRKLLERAVQSCGVEVLPGGSSELTAARPNFFDVSLFAAKLQTRTIGREFLLAHRMSSTQSFLEKTYEKLPIGTVLVAETQIGKSVV